MSDDDAVAGRHYKAAYQKQKAKNAELSGLLEILRNGNKALVERAHAQEREIAQLKKGNLALAEIDAQVRVVQEVHISRLENSLLMIFDRSEDAGVRDIALEAAQSLYRGVTHGMAEAVADAVSGVPSAVAGPGADHGFHRSEQSRRNRPLGGRSAT